MDKLTIDEEAYQEAEDVFSACLTRRPHDEITAFENGLKAYIAAVQSNKHSDDYTPCMTHADEALDGVVTRTKTPSQ